MDIPNVFDLSAQSCTSVVLGWVCIVGVGARCDTKYGALDHIAHSSVSDLGGGHVVRLLPRTAVVCPHNAISLPTDTS